MEVTQLKFKRPQKFALDAKQIEGLAGRADKLSKLGISVSPEFAASYRVNPIAMAMDAGGAPTQGVTIPSNGTPVQFLQEFLSGAVHILTTVRRADKIAPVVTAGEWHLEEVVLKVMEHTAYPQLYSDHGGLPLVSFNTTYERRQVVRFEMGIEQNPLSDARSAADGTSPQQEYRNALALGFETLRNDIAFNGFNVGTGRTYGILNDPNLPAYIAVPNGAGGQTEWSAKTSAEIVSDLSTAFKALEIQSGGNVDVTAAAIELTLPLGSNHELTKADSSFSNGMTAKEWLNENYPNCTIVTAPEFISADAGDSVFYLKATSVDNSGTDGGESMIQVVPATMRATGSVPNAKGGSTEGYTSAYAGVFTKRAYAVVRYSGI